ncbi:hypothetical protein ACEPAG_5937 [Sanghuangporus baumii]
MPPMKSRLSESSMGCSISFSDQETLIGQDMAWYQEPVSPSDELHDYAGQSSRGQPSKQSYIPPTVHTFSLPPGADGIPLLSVNLHSWAASSTKIPAFVEGQYISGQVQLNLRTPDKVKAITVSVEGYYSIPGYEAKSFLQVSETIWDSTMGDPRSTGIFLPHGADHSGKLHGKYSWSFKFEFPKAVELTGKGEKRLVHDARNGERLPPSLRGGHGRARIGYEIIVRIKRPGLRIGNSLTIPILYVISTQPCVEPFPGRPGYPNSTSTTALLNDPSGWKVFPEFQVNGSMNKSQISLSCMFALASPLSCARGSCIPCTFVISCRDLHALDAVASPSSPQVHLRRRLVLSSKLGGELVLDGQETIVNKATWTSEREPMQPSSGFRTVLRGKIEVPPSVTPSFTFGRLQMKYDVLVFPFDVPGFSRVADGPLLRVDVAVTTFDVESH